LIWPRKGQDRFSIGSSSWAFTGAEGIQLEVIEMKSSLIATALVLAGLAASSAEAMPVAAGPAGVGKEAPVVRIDYACGRGWHVTPWGECRPNRWRRPPPPYYWGHRPPPRYGWGDYRPRYHRDWHRPPPRW
jgi:hypothetical protein